MVGYRNDWSIATSTRLVVNTRRRATLEQLYERYALPLLTFAAFASDRPDSLNSEILLNPGTRERVEVWRSGPRYELTPRAQYCTTSRN